MNVEFYPLSDSELDDSTEPIATSSSFPSPKKRRNEQIQTSSQPAKKSVPNVSSVPYNNDYGNISSTPRFIGTECEQEVCKKVVQFDILSEILMHLPVEDLVLNVSLSCKHFRDIVNNERFIPWKKHFNRVLANARGQNGYEIDLVLSKAGISNVDNCVSQSLSYMSKLRRLTKKENILKVLRKQSNFLAVQRYVHTTLKTEHRNVSVWEYLGVIIFLIDEPTLICALLNQLFQNGVPSTDISEALYCLSSLLLASHRKFKISPRHYYNLSSAIHLFEFGLSPNQRLTYEQQRVADYNLRPDEVVRVIAFAGTGKTTTLIEHVKRHDNKNFLVLVFNKAVQLSSAHKFAANARCQTTHSLAFNMLNIAAVGYKIFERIRQNDIKNSKVLQYLERSYDLLPVDEDERKGGKRPRFDRGYSTWIDLTLKTMKSYMNSDCVHANINDTFVPDHFLKYVKGDEFPKKIPVPSQFKIHVAEDATNLWLAMCNPEIWDIPMLHDGYMKLFQLACRGKLAIPNLQQFNGTQIRGYDAILIDEAQDMNPAILDALRCQNVPKMFVGDPHQQIYAFRGAVDALDRMNEWNIKIKTFYLTNSFRFGPRIAYVANCWLQIKNKVTKKIFMGRNMESSLEGKIPKDMKTCFVCRTNLRVMQLCFKMVNHPVLMRHKFHVIGGLARFKCQDILDILNIHVQKRDAIKNGFLRNFSSIRDLKKYAILHLDKDLCTRIELVENHHQTLATDMNSLLLEHTENELEAQYFITTVHQTKGLEFDAVVLEDDFNVDNQLQISVAGISNVGFQPAVNFSSVELSFDEPENEVNILYVAITRAKKYLIVNKNVRKLLFETLNDFNEIPRFFGSLGFTTGQKIFCLECENLINKTTCDQVVLHRQKLCMSSGCTSVSFMLGGVVCCACVTHPAPLHYKFSKDQGSTTVHIFTSNKLDHDPSRRAYKNIISKQ